jgi:hypothetical protein
VGFQIGETFFDNREWHVEQVVMRD